jgi:malonyl CoA-acyl carrier protein transacylase
MLALLGTDEETAATFAEECKLTVANDNAPGQLILSGDRELLEDARVVAKERGVRAIALNVAGAFHSPSMRTAVAPFREALAKVNFADPAFTVFSGASTAPFTNFRDELADAIVNPVRWRQTMLAINASGIGNFTDVGPGEVLARMVKRIVPDAHVQPVKELLNV